MSTLEGKKVLVGVTGGIAAYKTPELVRRLRDAGAQVRVVMSVGAEAFITPLTLQAVSGHRVRTHLLDPEAEAGMGHIELARWADEILVAPATAHAIARFAAGLADDLLSTLIVATEARIWLAPAMNRVMWASPSVRDNCAVLESRGMRILGPGAGSQACGEQGQGRMLEPGELVAAVAGRDGRLAGLRFVVTAGPTHEPLDPVRFIGNRSSGRMGFAVAAALAEAGARVDLVAGPVQRSTPPAVHRHDVQTAREMRAAVMARIDGADGFVGVAAVADYRPADESGDKIKKSDESMAVELVPNPDILAEVAALPDRPRLVVGFAAETRDVEAAARGKLKTKRLDLIAANRVGKELGFDSEDNALEVFSSDRHWSLAPQSKTAVARELVAIIADCMLERESRANERPESQDS
ncbi:MULTISPECIES: bifunctional phosphopantothenoylcysteine decarboxylase/phosphopantothenate--cysteine ligase CoaBC [unclassified Wenzhouxiangella]|uniref:bifunctional phosphopantothenoylcysteine decarboxylase/phosphopantothenate--cysteine ligase CoaBC n=1 Tax=unclassified Wenzhouxiangella TaxID=2613841 RepID=UPI000E327E9A|nr:MULTISPECIES: bifunctional phosphopantothenoylcysteine decarboxylase/phosphopantothenate--cysteine ligase CoaBC [unclassified Wenzhouxiangella]RFF26240.1 bifunctional phosphopantothenoylcysteine decarboxylase/phosphopantothenate--cysteine ligase CoaBC [Wenzhouxiangella sp. 15181]RFP68236.1 bifunctional phosphopantothenoylcysteine decarboxylase/phosphopantothenate--cysteine ligase CoaBC [Wenzhouxiangella sp. 15190]